MHPRIVSVIAIALACAARFGVAKAEDSIQARVDALAPSLEAYVAAGMKAFDCPGVAIGIVTGGRLAYAKGFGTRRKGGEPVDTKTVFQIGSTTKAFLATTLAITVDRKKLGWDDRIVDLAPDFQLKDAWVTREFRVSDILAQRSGLPPYANDTVGILGADQPAMIRSLRHVEPTTSFRSTFTYTNITHMLAQRIVAERLGAPDWDTVVRSEIFAPLGMAASSLTAEAIEAAENHAVGHRWTAGGAVEVPFTPIFPYGFGGAGAINSTIDDLAAWVRLHLAEGEFDGKRLVSAENLAATKTPRVGLNDKMAYAMGWVVQSTPNGRIVWHNGGTSSFGAFIGTAPDKDVGVIVLTNLTNVGLPDAIGEWTFDRLLGNPEVDYAAKRLEGAKAEDAAGAKVFAPLPSPRPPPLLNGLAGRYANPSFGAATVAVHGAALVVTLAETGAKLLLAARDGAVFTATLVAEGRFAAIAANLGPDPMGFAEFEVNKDGAMDRFRLVMQADGQTYIFARE